MCTFGAAAMYDVRSTAMNERSVTSVVRRAFFSLETALPSNEFKLIVSIKMNIC